MSLLPSCSGKTHQLSTTVEDKCGHIIKPIPFLNIEKVNKLAPQILNYCLNIGID